MSSKRLLPAPTAAFTWEPHEQFQALGLSTPSAKHGAPANGALQRGALGAHGACLGPGCVLSHPAQGRGDTLGTAVAEEMATAGLFWFAPLTGPVKSPGAENVDLEGQEMWDELFPGEEGLCAALVASRAGVLGECPRPVLGLCLFT